jgi:predicted nucleic acid-binding protein
LTDAAAVIAVDTSTVINLNATGCAQEMIRAIPNKVVVTDVVSGELEEGRPRGRRDAEFLGELIGAGAAEMVQLDDETSVYFEQLVIGPAAMTLDDGEAATIAYAVGHQAIAIIDERKATRICTDLFREVRIGCTVDVLAHPEVQRQLGETRLAEALFNALYRGRMRVFPQHIEWVVALIGPARAAECTSLPSSARRPQQRFTRASGAERSRVENE